MCIICFKDSGNDMPSRETLRTCFQTNSDGAGFMFARNGAVHIAKGFMKFKHLYRAIKAHDFKKDEKVIIHFRWATHGATSAAQTHPFPVSVREEDLRRVSTATHLALAHNGIFPLAADRDLSDTMVFIRDYFAEFQNHLHDTVIREVIEDFCASSKVITLDAAGNVDFFGSKAWHEDKETGCKFSNNGYMVYNFFSVPSTPKWRTRYNRRTIRQTSANWDFDIIYRDAFDEVTDEETRAKNISNPDFWPDLDEEGNEYLTAYHRGYKIHGNF